MLRLSRKFISQIPRNVRLLVQSRKICTEYERILEGEGIQKKVFIAQNGKKISPWHDLNLWTNKTDELLMVNEIPKSKKEKHEVITDQEFNPIMQDTVTDKVSKVKHPRFLGLEPSFNYGMLPQTWEDSTMPDPHTNLFGDNDPLDICELGKRSMLTGNVCKVKLLGSFCVVDQGEMDWKVVGLNIEEADKLGIKNLKDYNTQFPGIIENIMRWFVIYKKYEGKRENHIHFSGKLFDLDDTIKIIRNANNSYKELIIGKKRRNDPFWLNKNNTI